MGVTSWSGLIPLPLLPYHAHKPLKSPKSGILLPSISIIIIIIMMIIGGIQSIIHVLIYGLLPHVVLIQWVS